MIIDCAKFEKEAAMQVASLMGSAARTAPKACGEDSITVKILEGRDLKPLADEAVAIGEKAGISFFVRDGEILRNCHCALLLGVDNVPLGLQDCGYCGFKDCGQCTKAGGHCALKLADLGIALGSAVSIAADYRIDNRIAYSLGKAAISLGLFPERVTNAYVVPLSISGKNVFFDRETVQQK